MHMRVLVADEGDIYQTLDKFAAYDFRENSDEARWDYFGVGGRFAGALPLKEPRRLRKFLGLLSAGTTMRADVAKKCEVDAQAFLVEPPVALVWRGQLYECPIFAEGEALAAWHTQFRALFAQIPEDATLQIVDAHA